ncbi:hypothetical protein LSPH24S_05746 [Lysinibacillus sphaericus]
MAIQKLTIMALLVAIAVAGSIFVSIPTGIARAYPVQHAINVIGAILLGPVPTIIVALLTAIIRILTGTGSLLAIPEVSSVQHVLLLLINIAARNG